MISGTGNVTQAVGSSIISGGATVILSERDVVLQREVLIAGDFTVSGADVVLAASATVNGGANASVLASGQATIEGALWADDNLYVLGVEGYILGEQSIVGAGHNFSLEG